MAFKASLGKYITRRPAISLLLAFLLLVAFLMLGNYIVRIALNYHAERTYLKDFYAQAATAERQAAALPFQNLTVSAKEDGSTGAGRRRLFGARSNLSLIKYCSGPGTYRIYTTDQTIHNARRCVKGVANYYWADTVTSESIDEIIRTMEAQGFQLRDSESIDRTKSRIINMYETGRGFDFEHNSGTYASVTFLNTAVRNPRNVNPDTWCASGLACKNLVKANSKQSHPYYIAVSITAVKDYTD